MSDYDPTTDPRFVPLEPDIPAAEKERLEELLGELENNIELFDHALVMFQHPGWAVLESGFDSVIEELDLVLRKEQDQGQWKFYRGQLAQVEWFRSLPKEMAERQRRLRRDHAQILRDLGRE